MEKMVKKTVLHSEDWYAVIKHDADLKSFRLHGGEVCILIIKF